MNGLPLFRLAISLWGVLCVFCFFVPPDLCAVSGSLSIREILEQIRQRYAAQDFEVDFVQESHLGAMGAVDTAEGHVYFKPPAMMHWHYKSPEQYRIITDGVSLWIYRSEDNQVMVGRAADYFGDTKWAQFFTEPARLLYDFNVQLAKAEFQQEDRLVLKLVPLRPQPNLAKMLLFVSRSTFDIVQSVTYNALGDKTILRFEGFRFNQGLDPAFFSFKIPEGVDVLQLGESRIDLWQ